MIIDTEDPVVLSHLNPVEAQMLRNVTQRLMLVARERVELAERLAPARHPSRGCPPDASGKNTTP
ncbi:MAG TPA: hypothetical protein VK196_10495 [Magnetospirillum sp.]|nr:hypothetical protein [Magnetospirillum sp.]